MKTDLVINVQACDMTPKGETIATVNVHYQDGMIIPMRITLGCVDPTTLRPGTRIMPAIGVE